ncbi:MAG TPA: hypothetical protein DGH68_02870 [Bacteroidetes bacterium]|jgi:hypothetical protein|nr:hypothetical protein [Bacteroidota bacterium]
MSLEDVKSGAQSSGSDESQNDEGQNQAADGSDKPDGKESGKEPRQIPYTRFKEVNDKATQSQEIVDWYREHVGEPEEVLEFKKWKQEQVKRAEKDEAKGKISPDKLAEVRRLMRDADPELVELLEERKRDKQEKMDAQFDDAEEKIRDLCKSAGFPGEEKIVARIAAHVMDEIKADKALMRKWNQGNLSCIDKAFKTYVDEFLPAIRKSNGKNEQNLADKRRISRLPSLPAGGSGVTHKAPERTQEDRGITKKTHDDAWAVFQSHMNND